MKKYLLLILLALGLVAFLQGIVVTLHEIRRLAIACSRGSLFF
jgi:hypothetical protein